MLTKEFNKLPLSEKSKIVLNEAKLINIFENHIAQKCFFYKLKDLKIDAIYQRESMRLLNIVAWETTTDRVSFIKNAINS